MEKDNELKGVGNSLDFGARIYDSRIGKFLSLDPDMAKFPYFSPYLYANNNPIFNVDYQGKSGVAHFIAKIAGGTFTTSGFGSVSFGVVKSVAFGKGVDKDGNVALFYSKTAGPSVSFDIGAEVGVKASVLPGIKNVSELTGTSFSFSVSASLKAIPASVGASIEYNSSEKPVGFGSSFSLGQSVSPITVTFENTKTTAVLFSSKDFNKFSKFADGSTSRNVSRMLKMNANQGLSDEGRAYGIYDLGESIMSLQPVEGSKNLYEAVITTEYHYKATGGHKDRIQCSNYTITKEERSGVYFSKDGEGNYKSSGFKGTN